MQPLRGFIAGAVAGAAGATALNAVTYIDMTWRGRPASDTPERTVEALTERIGVEVPGEGDERRNRLAGLGPLLGIATGVGVGAVGGLARGFGLRAGGLASTALAGGGAMAATDGSMAAIGVTDPRTWSRESWLADAVPHLTYGLVVTAVLRRLLP